MPRDNQFVAMLHYACPCCGKDDKDQSEIAIHRHFGDLSKVDGQVMGFGKPCAECQEMMAKGVVAVVVDLKKTKDQQNPYRCGEMHVMSEDWVNRAINDEDLKNQLLTKRMFYLDQGEAKQMGFLIKYAG